ncbi:hypothetical protein NQ314_002304, partial [Rhamnusium bicolor]
FPDLNIYRFVVGPYEENDYNVRSSQAGSFYRQQVQNNPNGGARSRSGSWQTRRQKNTILHIVNQMLRIYKKIIYRIKCCDRHNTCPHPFSCLYYTMQASLCILRRLTGKDNPSHALPAGLLAGIAFTRYPDTTVALYVMWKAAQITYNLGIDKGVFPRVPGFTEFLYSFSTAILFHAAILEPTSLRPSYWKFLHSISGEEKMVRPMELYFPIACMSRTPLEVWGLNTTESLRKVLEQTKTVPVVYF